MSTSRLRWVAGSALLVLICYVGARLGLILQIPNTDVSPLWPPSGIALASLVLFGTRMLPAIVIADFLTGFLTLPPTPAGFLASAGIAAGTMLEQLTALYLFRWFAGPRRSFEHVKEVFGLGVAAAVSCGAAGLIGATVLWLTGVIPGGVFGTVASTWWLGDAAGMLVLTPAICCWLRSPRLEMSRVRLGELLLVVGTSAVLAELAFGVPSAYDVVKPYVVIPGLLWAAFRFGPRETSLLAVLVAAIATVHTWANVTRSLESIVVAPFVGPSLSANGSLVMLQIFVCVVSVTALTLAAAASEWTNSRRELIRAKARYRDLYNNSPEFYVLVDAGTARIEQCNSTFARAMGMKRFEIIGRQVFDLYDPGCMDEAKKLFDQFRISGVVDNAELQLRRRNGSTIDVILNASAIRDSSGKIVACRSAWRDITERKHVESVLLENERRLRMIFEQASVGVALIETATGRFLRVNERYCEMVGYSEEEMARTTLQAITDPEDLHKDLDSMRMLVDGVVREFTMEKRYYRKDGSVVWVTLTVSKTWQGAEQHEHHIAVIQDITSRKQAEDALRVAHEKLRQLSQELIRVQETERKHLARELHDEIGQNLAALRFNMQLLRGAPEDASQRYDDSIGIVDCILKQVRELSLSLRPPLLMEAGLAAALRSYFEDQSVRSGLRIAFYSSMDKRSMSPDAELALFRIAQEALTNSIRYSKAQDVFVSLDQVVDHVELTIQDNGEGFDSKTLDNNDGRPRLGILGMEERAALLGGAFAIKSAPGAGAEIRVRIPARAFSTAVPV